MVFVKYCHCNIYPILSIVFSVVCGDGNESMRLLALSRIEDVMKPNY